MRKHRVQILLMGGQACVLYGGAEFSRDTDLAILASPGNLTRLHAALSDLKAETIAVPPLRLEYLLRGHAIHYRCQDPELLRMRIDLMAKMRGVAKFETLWRRRTVLDMAGGVRWDVMALPDLVRAKKTQRDKDWLMIPRLLEADYFKHRDQPKPAQIRFWLQELHTSELLVELACANLSASLQLRVALLHSLYLRDSSMLAQVPQGRAELSSVLRVPPGYSTVRSWARTS